MTKENCGMKIPWRDFHRSLIESGFYEENREFFKNYPALVDDGTETAITHMKISYNKFIPSRNNEVITFEEITREIIRTNRNLWYDSYLDTYRMLVHKMNKAKHEERIESQEGTFKEMIEKVFKEQEPISLNTNSDGVGIKQEDKEEINPFEEINVKFEVPKIKEIVKKEPIKRGVKTPKKKEVIEYNFKETYIFMSEGEEKAKIRICEDLNFALTKGSIIPEPASSKKLKGLLDSLVEINVLERIEEEPTGRSRKIKVSFLVKKEHKEKNLIDIAKLIIGKEKVQANPWEYIEGGKQLKTLYSKLLKQKTSK